MVQHISFMHESFILKDFIYTVELSTQSVHVLQNNIQVLPNFRLWSKIMFFLSKLKSHIREKNCCILFIQRLSNFNFYTCIYKGKEKLFRNENWFLSTVNY